MGFIVAIFFIQFLILESYEQCSFPQHLIGDWIGADRGQMTFANSTFMTSYRTSVNANILPETMDFTCKENQDNIYVLRSTYSFIFSHIPIEVYLCIRIIVFDSSLAHYYLLTDFDPFIRENLHGDGTGNATLGKICSLTPSTRSFISMVKNGEINQINRTCPTDFVSVFDNVTVQHHGNQNSFNCEGTQFDGCSDKTEMQIIYTEPCTNNPDARTLSVSGKYICLQSVAVDDETFLSAWNTDTGVGNPFSCWAMKKIGNTTFVTESPAKCNDNSSSTEITIGGVSLVLTDISDICDSSIPTTTIASEQQDTTASGLIGLWVLVSIPVLLLILVIAYVIVRYRAAKRRRRQGHFDLFGSTSTIHVDIVSKTKFDPRKIHSYDVARVHRKPAKLDWTLFAPKPSPRSVLYIQPKVNPLYKDVFDD